MFPKLVRISDERYSSQIIVERKGYITINVGRNPRATNLYWQLVDPKFSLLELGFELPSGRLVDCAVSLFNGQVEDRGTESLPNATTGTPLFDLSPWTANTANSAARGNHLEQPGRIRLVKKDGGLSLIVKDASPLRSVVYADKLICGFDGEDDLVALTLRGTFSV